MVNKIKLVIFDLFGIFFEFKPKNLELELKKNGIKVSVEEFNKRFKEVFQLNRFKDIEVGINQLAQAINEEDNKDFKKMQLSFFKDFWKIIKPNKETLVLVRFIKRLGFKVAILSNSFQIEQDIIEKLGLNEADGIFLSCDTKLLKPKKDAFLNVCKHFNLNPEDCLMVGDNYEKDLKPAKEIGMETINYHDIIT